MDPRVQVWIMSGAGQRFKVSTRRKKNHGKFSLVLLFNEPGLWLRAVAHSVLETEFSRFHLELNTTDLLLEQSRPEAGLAESIGIATIRVSGG